MSEKYQAFSVFGYLSRQKKNGIFRTGFRSPSKKVTAEFQPTLSVLVYKLVVAHSVMP